MEQEQNMELLLVNQNTMLTHHKTTKNHTLLTQIHLLN